MGQTRLGNGTLWHPSFKLAAHLPWTIARYIVFGSPVVIVSCGLTQAQVGSKAHWHKQISQWSCRVAAQITGSSAEKETLNLQNPDRLEVFRSCSSIDGEAP